VVSDQFTQEKSNPPPWKPDIARRIQRIENADTLVDELSLSADKVLSSTWTTRRKYYRQRARKFEIVEGVCMQGQFIDATDKQGNAIFAPVRFRDGVPVGADPKQ
jgi:hypothetical protein